MLFDARQFIDKIITFKVENADKENNKSELYIYSSSVPQEKADQIEEDHKFKNGSNYVTAETLYMVQRVTYDSTTKDHLVSTTFSQIDPKLGFGLPMIAKALPRLTEQWYSTLIKHLTK